MAGDTEESKMIRPSFLKTLLYCFVIACIAILIVLFVVVDLPKIKEDRAQFDLCPNIEAEFGATISAVYVFESDLKGERVRIESITPGGLFANSGLSGGEVIIDDLSLGQLCGFLNSSRGRVITLHVVQGGSGASLRDRESKVINISVPEKNQP